MDRTVRLWHVTRPECLCCFQHSDFVTSIQFHPRDDRFFLAGSLDTKFRLWSIPDKSVAFVASVPAMVTSVAFTPDGRYSIAGCLNGLCIIYDTDGLKPIEQIHVRSARGRNAKGSKITGIDTVVLPVNHPDGEIKLLITSNDSRVRLYNFRDRNLEAKYRGNENSCSQIRASFSDDGKHIICGSEDRRTYIWPTASVEKDMDKRAVEVFETHSSMVTAAIMAPTRARQVLGFSEDPIYDICNPPPVTLVNTADSPAKENGHSNRNSGASKQAQESPTYISRSAHPDGNIIIVANYSGRIKILRQDCAYQKRRYANWDVHSAISRRLLRRTNSPRHSIASSIGKESSHKTPSERILSWRNSVIRHHAANGDGGSQRSRAGTLTRNSSPAGKSTTPGTPRYSSPGSRPRTDSRSMTMSPPPSAYKNSIDSTRSGTAADASAQQKTHQNARAQQHHPRDRRSSPLPPTAAAIVASGRDRGNPLWLQGDQSNAYWNKITHDAFAAQNRKSRLSTPGTGTGHRAGTGDEDRKLSTGSEFLSSDYASSAGDGEEGDGDGGEVLKCDNCRGTNFRASRGRTGKQRLVCVRCLRPVENT